MASQQTQREPPVAVPHDRGVFEDDFSFPGLRTFRMYNCAGDLVEIAMIAVEWCDDAIKEELCISLNRRCPAEDHYHQDPPFPGRLPFKLI